MINLYNMLNIPTNASTIAIERAIRLARDRKDIEEKYLKLAENYLLDAKRRQQYNKQIGVSNIREKGLPIAGDKRYLATGLMLVAVLLVPLMIIMFLQNKAIDGVGQQKNDQYQQAQDAMQKAWNIKPASGETTPQAVQRTLDEITGKHNKTLEQSQ